MRYFKDMNLFFKDSKGDYLFEGDLVIDNWGYVKEVIYNPKWASFALRDVFDKDIISHLVFDTDDNYAPEKITKLGKRKDFTLTELRKKYYKNYKG
jgi:hypothetical protein